MPSKYARKKADRPDDDEPVGGPPPRAVQPGLEEGPDGAFEVRPVLASRATKAYRCPGCDQEIRPAVPHVVAWPAGVDPSEADRRHWHTPCWRARTRRGVKVHRSKNAPRHG